MRRFVRQAGFLCGVASVAVLAAGTTPAVGRVQPVALVSQGTVVPAASTATEATPQRKPA